METIHMDFINSSYILLEKEILFDWYEKLVEQSISCRKRKLQDGKVSFYKQEFFKQYFTHFLSIKILAPGLKLIIQGKEKEISALPSIIVLLRACIENYSMFYYIYRDSSCTEEKEFRFWSWFREGLINRQNFIISHLKEKQIKEKKLIDKIARNIEGNNYFKKLTDKQQKNYLKNGKWYYYAKSKLLELSGFSNTNATNCYNYFSSYTHPTSASHFQTSQAPFKDAEGIKDTMLNILFISAGLYLYSYEKEFSEISEIINKKDKEFIISWCDFGKGL
jgi:hypothetical protein